MVDDPAARGFVICWQCRELVAPRGPACPRCQAGIHPDLREQSLFTFIDDQARLRKKKVHGAPTRNELFRRKAWLETSHEPTSIDSLLETFGLDLPLYTIVQGWTSVGGYGWTVSVAGRQVTVAISTEELVMLGSDVASLLRIPLSELHRLEMSGGETTSGGGFVGGGFGLEGAAQGMIVAGILNRLTTKTDVNTLVYVAAHGGEAILHHGTHTPESLRILLSPAFGALSARRHSAEVTTAGLRGIDPIERLERLVRLREAGELTDQEYQAARAVVVAELTGK